MKEYDDIIKSAVNIIMQPILQLIEGDPHQWSTRPCSTCKAISLMIGKPFGCVKKAKEKNSN